MHNQLLMVTLVVLPSMEESLVDCLLEFERGLDFTSVPISAHDHGNQGLSGMELVTGRQKKLRFQLIIAAADLDELRTVLQRQFGGSKLRYWVTPILEGGVL
jgi:Protein of unknown function (DUF3240)